MGNYNHRKIFLGQSVAAYSASWIEFQLRELAVSQVAYLRSLGATAPANHLDMTMDGLAKAAKEYRDYLDERRAEDGKPPLTVAPEPGDAPRQTTDYLTPKQAAEQLGVSDRQARNLLAAGHLRGSRMGNRWMVDPTDLEDYKLRRDVA